MDLKRGIKKDTKEKVNVCTYTQITHIYLRH